jgi:hypothetical protein
MWHLTLRPALSLLAFLAGLAAHAALAGDPSLGLDDQVQSVERARWHEWHKLYEAAWMSDGATRRVYEELVCVRPDGAYGGRLLELPGEEAVCEERGAGVHPPDGTYDRFLKEHTAWSLKNMQFVREVGTPERANTYVLNHWLSPHR